MIPSPYQEAIYEHIKADRGNLMIEAVAGSGKTTTIVQAMRLVDIRTSSLFVAFNKHIAVELRKRIPPHAEAKTLHAIGYGAIKDYTKRYIKVDGDKCANILVFDIFECKKGDTTAFKEANKYKRPVCQLVSLMKSIGFGEDVSIANAKDVDNTYKIDFGLLDDNKCYTLAVDVYKRSLEKRSVIDFDDMLLLPVVDDMPLPTRKMIFVDEAQDLNRCQIKMLMKMATGTIVAVGDPSQSIYAFRGADPMAMPILQGMFNMLKLPLSVSYRCPVKVVDEARAFVPRLEASEDAAQGIVDNIRSTELVTQLRGGDYVLCRTTAPVVELAISLIEARKKAYVCGRQFGIGLIALLPKIDDLEGYLGQQWERLKYKPAAWLTVQDQVMTMQALVRAYDGNSARIKSAINDMFSDDVDPIKDPDSIILSTIHKSKGLEANRVFLLRPDLVPHPSATTQMELDQERNLQYIAITRAKEAFYYVDRQTKE